MKIPLVVAALVILANTLFGQLSQDDIWVNVGDLTIMGRQHRDARVTFLESDVLLIRSKDGETTMPLSQAPWTIKKALDGPRERIQLYLEEMNRKNPSKNLDPISISGRVAKVTSSGVLVVPDSEGLGRGIVIAGVSGLKEGERVSGTYKRQPSYLYYLWKGTPMTYPLYTVHE